MRGQGPLKWLVALFAVGQIAASAFPFITGVGRTVAERSAETPTAVTPATYAFAIWGLIYLADLIFAAYQLFTRREDHLLDDLRAPAALAFAANTAWAVWVPMRGVEWGSLAIIVIGLLGALATMVRLKRSRAGLFSRDGLLVKAPLALLAGWVSVATFANAAAVIETLAPDPLQLGPSLESAAFVAGAAGVATLVTVMLRTSLAYPAAALWGLVAITVANQQAGGDHRVFLTAATGSVILAVATILSALRRKPARSGVGA